MAIWKAVVKHIENFSKTKQNRADFEAAEQKALLASREEALQKQKADIEAQAARDREAIAAERDAFAEHVQQCGDTSLRNPLRFPI